MSALCQKRPHAPQQTACTGCNDLVGHFVYGCAEPRALAVLRLTAKSNLVERIPPGRLASHCLPLRRAGCGNRAGNAMTPLPLRQRARRAIWGLIGLVLFAASAGRAQDYPNRTVTIVAPSAPGGMYSILARLIGSKLERLYDQSFVIENRPGASSITGSVFVAHAAPDGYTLMTAASTTMATNVSLHKNLPYDPLTDFIPIVQIARSPEVLLINAALPVRSIEDLAVC